MHPLHYTMNTYLQHKSIYLIYRCALSYIHISALSLTNPLHLHPIQLLLLSQPCKISLHIFHLMKCPLPSTYPARIIAVILREFTLFFSFYNLSTIFAYKTIFIIKSFRGGVILHALLLSGGGSLYVISIFLIHDIRIYEPQSGMSLTAFAGM